MKRVKDSLNKQMELLSVCVYVCLLYSLPAGGNKSLLKSINFWQPQEIWKQKMANYAKYHDDETHFSKSKRLMRKDDNLNLIQ